MDIRWQWMNKCEERNYEDRYSNNLGDIIYIEMLDFTLFDDEYARPDSVEVFYWDRLYCNYIQL